MDFKEIQKYSNNKYILDRFSYNDLVTNEYIEEIFFALYNIHIELIDKPVSLLGYCCPCCNYKVYRKMEIFDILFPNKILPNSYCIYLRLLGSNF